MRTPNTLSALHLLEDILPHCREHGGELFSCERISSTLARIEDEAVAAYRKRQAVQPIQPK